MEHQKYILLNIKVQPHSKKQKIMKLDSGVYKLWVQSPPEKGKANKEIITILAGYFGQPFSRVKIIRGHGSRNKVIRIEKKAV